MGRARGVHAEHGGLPHKAEQAGENEGGDDERHEGGESRQVALRLGSVGREENRRLMRNHGLIVLIDRPIDDIMLDIRAEKRPFLAQKGREEIERIYNERMPIYKSVADVVMDNGNGFHNGLASLEEIVRRYA